MTRYTERLRSSGALSRRSFVKASAASVAALAAAGGLAACAPAEQPAEEQPEGEGGGEAEHVSSERDLVSGTWVSAACWHNCGGRCVNKVLVQDGVVVRQKTDDTHEDSYEYPQMRCCGRGRSQRHQVFGVDRLKYPMKRKHWEPLTGGDKSLRGCDEWERISWDEALEYVANEIKHVVEEYGNRAIYCPGGDDIFRTLALNGGYTYSHSTSSVGNWAWIHNYGYAFIGMEGNDRFDWFNAQYIVMFGCNPAWSSAGNPSWFYRHLKDAGVEFYAVDPYFNDSYDLLDASWVPIYPGSDCSILLGIAYTMITEDAERGLIDWDFLRTYSSGFDADMMPEGADPADNFKDYVLGTYDGVPKTPEWASEHCGADPEQIRNLAYILGKDNNVGLEAAFAPGRAISGEYFPALFMTLGLMGGHIGKSGNFTTTSSNSWGANSRADMFVGGTNGLAAVANPIGDMINDVNVWESILAGKYLYTGSTYAFAPGEERDIDIHLIYHGGLNGKSVGTEVCSLQTKPNINKGIEAHRKVDFVVTQAYVYNTDARYSDIVLPVTTEWEREGRLFNYQKEAMIAYGKVCEPLYEAKSDQQVAIELAEKLGLDPTEIFPISEKQQYFNELASAQVTTEDGTGYEPVATITQEDIDDWGVEGTPQEGRIPLQEWIDTGIFQIERKEGDQYPYIGYEAFIKDPVANPRATKSGKFEIYCETVRDMFAAAGNGNGTASATPIWQPVIDGYEGTFADWDTKTKGEYPYQVFNPHYLRRSHSTFDNVGWLRKAWAHPVFISAQDAEEKGIETGDTVLIFNENGKTLRLASVTNRLMPGVIGLPHGGWVDIDEETGIDRGGADNILCSSRTSVSGVCGWNTCLVDFEKYDGEPLEADVDKPQTVIF